MALNVFSKESGLSKKSIVIKNVIPFENKGELVFRIFNLSPKGYIVVSAEDNTIPILGYGLDSNFSFDDAPPALLFLLGEYKNEISYIKEKGLKADENIISKWATYSSPEYNSLKSYSPSTVLLETNWGQNSPYNNDCPLDPETGNRCKVGCNAVALGQILNYWECKVFPDGTNTYTPLGFTNSLTVNFYDQDYDWDDIGPVVSATSELLYHCGVAMELQYSESSTYGFTTYTEYAMENYFGFETSGIERDSNYSSSTWINMLKSDIDAERPIYYAAIDTSSNGGGHAWVIDGYNSNNEFHCNWGWNNNNNQNDWYYLTDLTPTGTSYNFDNGHHAILGAEPILDACSGLSGASVICSSNESYSVTIPSSASVVWSKNSNLDQVGGNTGTTYTVNEGSSGSGHVTATIKNSQNVTFLTRTKDVCVGTPAPAISSTWSEACNCYVSDPLDVNTTYDWDMITCNPSTSSTDYVWEVWGYELQMFAQQSESTNGTRTTYPYTAYGKHLSYTFYDEQYYTIKAKQKMCGSWSSWANKYITVGDGLLMVIAPNPTGGETTLSIESTSEEKTVDETAEWELEIYSPTQALKEKRTNLKGNSTTIQTQGWKEGVYVVRVKFSSDGKKDEVLTGKLVVKK